MFFIQAVVLIVVILGAAWFALARKDGEIKGVSIPRAIGGILIILATWIGLGSFGTLGAGERGVVLRFGAATTRVIQPGLYVVTPFVESVHPMDVRVQVEKTAAAAASKDLQAVRTEIALNFALDPSKVADVYRTLGDKYKERIIDPAVTEAVKATTARFNAEQLISERHSVKEMLTTMIATRLHPHGIIVAPDGVSVTDFQFADAFEQAIEAKVTATQQAMKAENDLRTKRAEAEMIVVKAEADAQSIEIKARAVNAQGGADYVRLQAIEKWDGALPVNMYGSAPVPFVNVK